MPIDLNRWFKILRIHLHDVVLALQQQTRVLVDTDGYDEDEREREKDRERETYVSLDCRGHCTQRFAEFVLHDDAELVLQCALLTADARVECLVARKLRWMQRQDQRDARLVAYTQSIRKQYRGCQNTLLLLLLTR